MRGFPCLSAVVTDVFNPGAGEAEAVPVSPCKVKASRGYISEILPQKRKGEKLDRMPEAPKLDKLK